MEVEKKDSIFYLPEDPKELDSSNLKIGDYHYPLIRSLNNIQENSTSATDNKFGNQSSVTYRWNWDAESRWVPYLSYMELLVELSKDAVGTQLSLDDDVAPSMGCASTMFTDIRYKIDQNEVSRLDQNVAQIDALEKRLNKSGSWMKELGGASNFYQSSFYDRQKQVIVDPQEMINSYIPQNLLIGDIFGNLTVGADSVQWIQANNRIQINNANDGNGNITLDNLVVGDYVSAYFNGIYAIGKVTAIAGFPIADGASGSFDLDLDYFGANAGPFVLNVYNSKIEKYYFNEDLSRLNKQSISLSNLFPGIDVANDTIGWTQVGKIVTITDNSANNLTTIIKVGDFVEFTFNGLQKISRITSVTGFNNNSGTFTVDYDYGADVAGQNFNLTASKPVLYKYIKQDKPRNVKTFRLAWQPALSIFRYKKALPACYNNELEFFVDTGNYKKKFIQSLLADRVSIDNGGTDYKLRILDMVFRPCKITGGDRIVDKKFYIDLQEISCQKKVISSANGDELTLEVKPSTMGLAIAWQDQAAGSNSLYPETLFKISNDQELNLSSYYVRYAGRQRPNPNPQIDSFTANTDKIVDLYMRNQLSNCQYFSDTQETLEEWKERGIYFYHPWPKSAEDRDTFVQISSTFDSLSSSSINLLLFSFYRKVALVELENSKLKDFRIINA